MSIGLAEQGIFEKKCSIIRVRFSDLVKVSLAGEKVASVRTPPQKSPTSVATKFFKVPLLSLGCFFDRSFNCFHMQRSLQMEFRDLRVSYSKTQHISTKRLTLIRTGAKEHSRSIAFAIPRVRFSTQAHHFTCTSNLRWRRLAAMLLFWQPRCFSTPSQRRL